MQLEMIRYTDIAVDNDFNCRDTVNPIEVRELAKNIQQNGLIEPIVVRKCPEKRAHLGKAWQLIAGYRRISAWTLLAKEDPEKYALIPATIIAVDDKAAFQINLSENVARAGLNIKEEAKACGRLLAGGMTQMQIADALGMSRGWVQNRLRMYDLKPAIQEEIVNLGLQPTVINQIAALPTEEEQFAAIRKITDAKLRGEKVKNVVINDKKKEAAKEAKTVPNRDDVLKMIELVGDSLGYGLPTRLLAWTQGMVDDNTIVGEIRQEVEKLGRDKV